MVYEKERLALMEADLFRRFSPEHPEMGGNSTALQAPANKPRKVSVSLHQSWCL